MARVAKKPDERRSDLVACAQKLFYTKGYESTSVRDIVDEAGVAKGTFYYYFDSKQAILEATVDELAAYAVILMRNIVDDETLDATEKWVLALRGVGNWKTERKSEMIALVQMMSAPENMLLQYEIRSKMLQTVAPELTRIVEQGVEEGTFDTAYVADAAEITLAIWLSLSDTITDTLLYPERFDDPAGLARRKVASVQTAIERVLGAAPDSLPMMDAETLDIWFANSEETETEKAL